MTKLRIQTAALVYGFLILAAFTWGLFRDDTLIFFHPAGYLNGKASPLLIYFLSIVSGVVFGLIVTRMTRFSVHKFKWAKVLHLEFRGLLGPMKNMDVIAYALFSSVGEELFFRGAMQPELGIVVSSLIFGLLHIAPGKKFMPWPFQAVAIGFAFGFMFWFFGNIIAPLTAHFLINYQNLHFINNFDPSMHLPKVFSSTKEE